MKVNRFLVAGMTALLLALAGGSPLSAQFTTDTILVGIDSVRTDLILTWDDRLPANESAVRSRLETVLRLELQDRGIMVAEGAEHSVLAELTIIAPPGGTGVIAYAYSLNLVERGIPSRLLSGQLDEARSTLYVDLDPDERVKVSELDSAAWHRLDADAWARVGTRVARADFPWPLIVTWQSDQAGVVTVGSSFLEEALERTVIDMAQDFANAYLSANR